MTDGLYHIYDITNRIRDSADRINGLERPKPNEGYALTNDVSNSSVSNESENVKNKDVFGFVVGEDADVNEDLLEELATYHPGAEVDANENIGGQAEVDIRENDARPNLPPISQTV